METDLQVAETKPHHHDYFVDIEGTVHLWPSETITTEEIIALGGWPSSQGVIEIDRDNNNARSSPDKSFISNPVTGSQRKCDSNGDDMRERIQRELDLLKTRFAFEDHPDGQWVRIMEYPLPSGWCLGSTQLAFQIPFQIIGASRHSRVRGKANCAGSTPPRR